jgi:hypothetical protein
VDVDGRPGLVATRRPERARVAPTLTGLDSVSADPDTQAAVLLATEDNGELVGAWSRAGAALLRDAIKATPRGDAIWLEIAAALNDGVTGG